MAALIASIQAHAAVILGVLFAISEALAAIPAVNANSVFQLVFGWLKKEQA
jgi:hypothetical protein